MAGWLVPGSGAAARTVRVTCRDGMAANLTSCRLGCSGAVTPRTRRWGRTSRANSGSGRERSAVRSPSATSSVAICGAGPDGRSVRNGL